MLTESVEIIRQLWSGEDVSFRGDHFTVEDCRIWSLPDSPPQIAIAGSGPESLSLAVEQGDALVLTDPLPDLVTEFKQRKGEGARVIGQVPSPTTATSSVPGSRPPVSRSASRGGR